MSGKKSFLNSYKINIRQEQLRMHNQRQGLNIVFHTVGQHNPQNIARCVLEILKHFELLWNSGVVFILLPSLQMTMLHDTISLQNLKPKFVNDEQVKWAFLLPYDLVVLC